MDDCIFNFYYFIDIAFYIPTKHFKYFAGYNLLVLLVFKLIRLAAAFIHSDLELGLAIHHTGVNSLQNWIEFAPCV